MRHYQEDDIQHEYDMKHFRELNQEEEREREEQDKDPMTDLSLYQD